ncbi:helix-turn-helix domain-containing protein [Patulibacter medicamentivorans]|uniref:helix-turn-helix domain-containing protein n=1 Tax=Patulibacter medicamentivorans TaxID=1097667 RepID=UPI00058BBDD6|nr:helix-turn-helix transcriptional regulator [Patulibacter medicamentivorans]
MRVTRSYHPISQEAGRLLGAQVHAARVARGWTLQELAERVGATPHTVRKVEHGDLTVGLGVALDAAVLVGVPLFVEERARLASEVGRAEERLTLLPRRVRSDRDVDDDF